MLLCCLCVSPLLAQLQDSFTDGDLKNPTWQGDTIDFKVNDDFRLQLDAPPISGISRIFIENHAITDASFKFYTRMDFNPSSQNYLRIYLQAQDSLFDNQSEVFLQLGASQDKIQLFQHSGEGTELLTESVIGLLDQSEVELWFQINRGEGAVWEIMYSQNNLNWDSLDIGIVSFDLLHTDYFAFECHYTSTRSTLFYFDDIHISGEVFEDTESPKLNAYILKPDFQVCLEFNEEMDSTWIENLNLESLGAEINSWDYQDNIFTYCLILSGLEWNTFYTLDLSALYDIGGNPMEDTTIDMFWQKVFPGDIRITEIMADPSPPVYLPEQEYIELFNATNHVLNLEGMHLNVGTKTVRLGKRSLEPMQYMIVTDGIVMPEGLDSTQFYSFSDFPTISNNEEFLCIKDSMEQFISAAVYHRKDHLNSKDDGGWSLELGDLEAYCYHQKNWFSSDGGDGGSPGKVNTIESSRSDSLTPEFQVTIPDSETLVIYANIFLGDQIWFDIQNYTLNGEFLIQSVRPGNTAQSILLNLRNSLSMDIEYQLQFTPEMEECTGKEIVLNSSFQLPQNPRAEDVFANEVLFDALEEKGEFIELFNGGEETIDCYDLILSQSSLDSGTTSFYAVSEKHILWKPSQFLVLSPDVENVKRQYGEVKEALFIEMSTFPTLPQAGATVKILKRNHMELEQFCYEDDWHSDYLAEFKGVSLERKSLDSEACMSESWTSGSVNTGYASPGRQNSASFSENNAQGLSVSNTLIYINKESGGLHLFFNLEDDKTSIDAEIYSKEGMLLQVLAKSMYAPGKGQIYWEGEGENGDVLPAGSYILSARISKNTELLDSKKWLINLIY